MYPLDMCVVDGEGGRGNGDAVSNLGSALFAPAVRGKGVDGGCELLRWGFPFFGESGELCAVRCSVCNVLVERKRMSVCR